MQKLHLLLTHKKLSFGTSIGSGMGGFLKGGIINAAIGALGGALIGALIGAASLALGGLPTLALGAAAIFGTAASGALIGGAILAPLGALAGLVTGVVRSRETNQPTATDIVNVAKISFAQGVNAGVKTERAHAHGKGQFEKAYMQEKTILAERQIEH